ncbi:hypothetical protein ACO0LO_13625 [Undibacterium sp. TJN25]|uniref:hypothetical protein n=1 Tax=Undibacterium sp. TJN25 TaxID=3413056 RepID=UPI003BEFC4C4
MDNTLTPLSPLSQTGSPTPVDRVNARLLVAGASSAASVAPADTLAANDVIELSPAARLLSAASATQSLGSNPQGFSSVLGAAINFASAFNSFNSLSGLGNNNNALPGFSTGGSDPGDIFSLPGTLGSIGQSTDASGTDLLLQALTNTPLNAAASAGNGNGNGASLLTGLANVGITLQSGASGQLPISTSASLVVDPLKLQSAFNANPAATSAVLAQAASSFAPLAASLVAQSNNFFLTQQDLNSSTGIEDIFTTQLELQLAAARLPLPTAVTAANAALQKTLQDEALSEAIVSAQNAALAEVQASAAANAAGANNSAIQATAPAAPTAPTKPTTTPTTASTAATPQQDNSDDTATPAQAASSAVAAPAADTNAAASTVARIASAISTPLSANGGPEAATTVATPAPAATTATAATTAVAQSPATASQAPSNLITPSAPSALTQAQNIATQNALSDAAAAALLVQQNAVDNAQAADAGNAQQADDNSTLAPAQAATLATTAATVNSTIPAQPAVDATIDNTLLTGLEQANADALAGAAVPATATAETTDQAANTANPETNPALDPAFAAAIAAYSLRAPVANIVDDRNARELGKPAVEAVNSVESVSAVQPVTLDVHDEVAAARRNEMLRNDTARS